MMAVASAAPFRRCWQTLPSRSCCVQVMTFRNAGISLCRRSRSMNQQKGAGKKREKKREIVKKEPAVSSKFKKILLVLQSDLLAVTLALAEPPAQKPGHHLQIQCTVRALASPVTAFHPFCDFDFTSKRKQTHSCRPSTTRLQVRLCKAGTGPGLQLCTDTGDNKGQHLGRATAGTPGAPGSD